MSQAAGTSADGPDEGHGDHFVRGFLRAPGRLDALRAAAPVPDDEQVWKTYLKTLLVGL